MRGYVLTENGPALMEDLTGKVSKSIVDSLVPAPVKAFTFLGKLYALPFDANMSIFMWNTDLYKAAGLDPAKPPQNWTEFMDYSKKLATGGKFATLFTFGDAARMLATCPTAPPSTTSR